MGFCYKELWKVMENKVLGFQYKPIYPLSFKFISKIQITKDRWSKAYIPSGSHTHALVAFDNLCLNVVYSKLCLEGYDN